MTERHRKVAVVLSGCGYLDGSEIHEAVSVLVHLSRHAAVVRCFAPDAEQAHHINHYTGAVEDRRQRNCLHESARIARGGKPMGAKASPGAWPLSELEAAEWDAVIFPGGFGAAKNLCTFAVDGADCDIEHDVERVVKTFHAVRKPIGMCCIAPVIAAKVLGGSRGGPGCTVTLGAEGPAAAAVRAMGAEHMARKADEICVNDENLLVTTPAYMLDAPLYDIFRGIGAMVDATLERCAESSQRSSGIGAIH